MYDYADYNLTYADAATIGTIGGALAGMMMTFTLIGLAIAVVQIIAMWKIYTKAGQEGWKAIIPIYNFVILFKIAGLSPWLILCYLAAVIPVIGGFVTLGMTIYLAYNLAKAFGKGGGFTVGLVLLAPVFYMILGFGNAQYIGNNNTEVKE